ncbi:MAG: bifunctional diaminohydroxyphosphoribosylaminopyrimidine deaminase/5-amino-6-(5-phosphoribosylamino)uracil reductase RibD [Mariprofundaceae bacterium]|nr:bifunctional diaminohydroxyphosphoribosylaminopyrimidine deaminase/5-amino-6-(5-phosphoribosylamino)uracil reductase RibD [Mariprofundaceae bacterium]
MQDIQWMKLALKLAKKGIGRTHPNPRVGAVVVKDGVLVGKGWHQCAGEAHAEVHALNDAGEQAKGATIYVTLEPCSGFGRTPPCTQAILNAGIQRVVFASADPNPAMAAGEAVLKQHGLDVSGGVLSHEADALNRPFFHYLNTKRAYVIAKAAISLDGKLATRQHHSQWITGKQSRQHVHHLRATCDAIMVGAGTLRDDNPSLTVRDARLRGTPPLRVIIATHSPEFRDNYQILSSEAPSIMYVHANSPDDAPWQQAGVTIVQVNNLQAALEDLAERGCLQVLVEGGGTLHASLFEQELADELVLYQAPVLIGGINAVNLWHGLGIAHMSEAVRLLDVKRQKLGVDMMIRGRLSYHHETNLNT